MPFDIITYTLAAPLLLLLWDYLQKVDVVATEVHHTCYLLEEMNGRDAVYVEPEI